jgi:hypothetical protein
MESLQQQHAVCHRCGKPIMGVLTRYAACECVKKMKKLSPKELRRSIYVEALVNTIRTARTAARLATASPNPRLAGVRR